MSAAAFALNARYEVMPPADDLATLVTTRIVPGRLVPQFRLWSDALDRAVAQAPGHRSSVRLEQAGGLFHLIHQFDRAADRDAWLASTAFVELTQQARAFPVERRQCGDGRRVRLTVPSESAANRGRTFIATWLAVFPLLLILSTLVRSVAGDLPLPVQLLFSSLMLTGLLQFVVLPRVQRVIRPWALSDDHGRARTRPA